MTRHPEIQDLKKQHVFCSWICIRARLGRISLSLLQEVSAGDASRLRRESSGSSGTGREGHAGKMAAVGARIGARGSWDASASECSLHILCFSSTVALGQQTYQVPQEPKMERQRENQAPVPFMF